MTEEQNVFLTMDKVCNRYGGVNSVTIKRWSRDPELEFPQPLIVGRRWYFKLKEIEEWEEKRRAMGFNI